MLDEADLGIPSLDDVEAVLAALDRLAPALGPVDRETFAFNVLMNALGSVLERLRLSEPGLVPAYVEAAQVMLQDA